MKKLYATFILSLFVAFTHAQITTTFPKWEAIGDTNLSIVTDDADNTDGANDGAILVDGQSAVTGQGVSYTFNGSMTLNEVLNIKTYVYNRNSSYVSLKVELVNTTDNAVLAASSSFTVNNSTTAPVLTTLNYTAVASDVGDTFMVRYVRTDNGHTARNFVIDNLSLNNTFVSVSLAQTCPFTLTPDLALSSSNATIESEINSAVSKFSDDYLGTSAPSASQLSSAESSYAALNISVNSGNITGNAITSFNQASFLKTFAQHLKHNPSDANIKTKALNTVWWVSKQFCSGVLPRDYQKYAYQNFARPASLLKDHLTQEAKDLFAYTLYKHTNDFAHFWSSSYDTAHQTTNGAIDTDLIYNILDAMLAYSLWYDTADERYRYMRGYKRYLNRFFSHTIGTTDGIKKDGSGFHHWVGYNNYMYAYRTAANLLYYLDGTSFQVDQGNYEVFRDAVYLQYAQSNDNNIQALSTSGRNPHIRKRQLTQLGLKRTALAGKNILGISTADPLLAGIHNRIYGTDPELNYNTITPLTAHEGAYQVNHSNMGVFRKDNWVAVNKGFSDNMWGSEIYTSQNRYGRYQSYGAMEILYPGTLADNGYDVNTWNWNYNPGATTIVLPWDKLHAERGRIDELQQKRFVGALAFKNKNSALLNDTHGTYGVFAMDFQEAEGRGWGTTHSSENHNDTFTFKKSTFSFDDIIVCLASNINNDDSSNPTVTTLYQRKNNNSNNVTVNGTTQNGTASYSDASDNWVISKYNTGFYIVTGGGDLNVWNGNQQVPSQNQTDQNVSGNPTGSYSIGYINHGTNPANESYEYIVKPNTNSTEMQTLGATISGGNKPYTVHQQDANAHIIEHVAKKAWGYSVFSDNVSISNNGLISNVDKSSLIMYETNSSVDQFTMAVSNPDIGYVSRANNPSVEKKIRIAVNGNWSIQTSNANISIISSSASSTVIEFTTKDGLPVEASFNKNISIPAPQNLAAANTTETTTDLSWSASTGATNYDVYQGTTVIATVSTTSYQVTGLVVNTAYNFSVKAKDNANHVSPSSNVVNITTPDTTAPSAPSNLIASGTTQTLTNLSWSNATDNVGVTNYDVYQGSTIIATVSTGNYQVTGLTANTSYTFSVRAKDAANNISDSSNTINVTTLANQLNYCASSSRNVNDEYIGRVQLNTINNTSTGQVYSDFTSISTNLSKGSQYTITITPTWTGTVYREAYSVWIDYNADGDFNDSGENVWSRSATRNSTVSGSFTIPSNAIVGTTRMRVSMKYNSNPSPCEVFTYGEVEDYSVNIQNGGASKSSIKASNVPFANHVENDTADNSFLLYPNPVKNDNLNVNYFESRNIVSYKIFNFLGQTVVKGTLEKGVIHVGELSAGSYIIRFKDGEDITTRKLIKE